ncbi:uncharacterized protein isoform X2 [Danio rerio]|uniref:Uncharacterized protein isoform X2 n=2 Tax=Danio rerio TaxID=7955 RepID=A0AC58H866_DANRE
MVARTEAMNIIRYEQYLEENFPRWQQRLKDIRVSEKSKRVQQHLKNHIQHMEQDRGQAMSFNSPDPSQTSHTVANSLQAPKDIKPKAERCNQNAHHPYLPPTWLTGSQPFISGLPHNNFPKDYKNLQNIQALNHPYYPVPGDSLHQSDPPVQQKTPLVEHLWQRLQPTAHFTPAAASWPPLPVVNPMMEVPGSSQKRVQRNENYQENVGEETIDPNEENHLRVKHRRNGKESDRTSELDCKPVRLSVDCGGSSEGSAGSSENTISEMQKQRKTKRNGTKSQANGNKSEGSSTISEDAPDSHSDTKTQKPHKKHSSQESIIRKKSISAASQDEDDQDENISQEAPQCHIRPEKKEEPQGQNIREEDDSDEGEDDSCDIIVAMEKVRFRNIDEEDEGSTDEEVMGKRHEIEAGGKEKPEMEDEEDGSEGEEARVDDDEVMGNRGGTEASDNEEPEGGEDEGQTTEEEGRENSFQGKSKEGNIEGSGEDDNQVNTSERDIHNSLEELYSDETEEGGVNNQDVDDEDDDEVVVEKAHPWSRDPLVDRIKSSDDDDDIEGLLNPVNSQTQKKEDVTEQSNDEPSGSEEESLPQKNPAATKDPVQSDDDDDDEFDHFYD